MRAERLPQKPVCPDAQSPFARGDAGHDHGRDRSVTVGRPQPLHELAAVESWMHEIDDDQFDLRVSEVQPEGSISGDGDLMPGGSEGIAVKLERDWVV